MPRDIVIQGVDVARSCACNKVHGPRLPRAQIKSNLATPFNEMVQHDLFFLRDETFSLCIDERIRWETVGYLPEKTMKTMMRLLMVSWLRTWGPVHNLLSTEKADWFQKQRHKYLTDFN